MSQLVSRPGERTLQAQGRRRRLDPEAGAGSWKASATKVSCVFVFLHMFDELVSKAGVFVYQVLIFPFSNPSSAKQTKVPAAFREDLCFLPLLVPLLIPGLGQLILFAYSQWGHHNFLRLMSTWLSFRSVLVLLFLSSRLEVWKKKKPYKAQESMKVDRWNIKWMVPVTTGTTSKAAPFSTDRKSHQSCTGESLTLTCRRWGGLLRCNWKADSYNKEHRLQSQRKLSSTT